MPRRVTASVESCRWPSAKMAAPPRLIFVVQRRGGQAFGCLQRERTGGTDPGRSVACSYSGPLMSATSPKHRALGRLDVLQTEKSLNNVVGLHENRLRDGKS